MPFPFTFRLFALSVAFVLGLLSSHALADTEKNYTGHYEILAQKSTRAFSLDVKQKDDDATISFSASMVDGSGAAPDAEGTGQVEDGILNFKFKDSFNNEGTGVLTFRQNGYHLSLTVTKAVDPAPFHFYGAMILKQTSTKPDN
jgi:hypothetical protein